MASLALWPGTARAEVVITNQPASQVVPPGASVIFSVVATGQGALRYQWRRNGVNIPNGTSASLLLSNVQPQAAGRYAVVVADATRSVVTSERADLVVMTEPIMAFADFRMEAGLLTSTGGLGTASNMGATLEAGERNVIRIWGGASVWVRWKPPYPGIATLETTGSDFDTILGVYDEANRLVAANDDGSGFGNSRLKFNANPNTEYAIVVDGVGGQTGRIVFAWRLEVTQNRLPEIFVQPTDQIAPLGSSVNVHVIAETGSNNVQWFRNGQLLPAADQASVNIQSLSATNVGIYVARISDPASGRVVFTEPVEVQVSAERVASRNKFIDVAQASLGLPQGGMRPRDGTSGGVARGYTGTQIFSNEGGTTDWGEPAPCGVIGGSSYWFVYQPLHDGLLEFNTDGSSFDTVLSVFRGTDLGNLVSVDCDDDDGADGQDSKVTFPATEGELYFVVVDGPGAASGTAVLNYNLTVSPMILAQPESQAVVQGSNATFTAVLDGHPLFSQWYFENAPVVDATNTSLIISNAQTGAAGRYWVVTTNVLDSVTSTVAELWIVNTQCVIVTYSRLNDGFHVRVASPATGKHLLQASTNLTDWVTLATNTAPRGIADFLDPAATNLDCRFYRAKAE